MKVVEMKISEQGVDMLLHFDAQEIASNRYSTTNYLYFIHPQHLAPFFERLGKELQREEEKEKEKRR